MTMSTKKLVVVGIFGMAVITFVIGGLYVYNNNNNTEKKDKSDEKKSLKQKENDKDGKKIDGKKDDKNKDDGNKDDEKKNNNSKNEDGKKNKKNENINNNNNSNNKTQEKTDNKKTKNSSEKESDETTEVIKDLMNINVEDNKKNNDEKTEKPTTIEHTLAIKSFKHYRDVLQKLIKHLQKGYNFKLRYINGVLVFSCNKDVNKCEFLNIKDEDEYKSKLNDFGYNLIKNAKFENNIKKFLEIYTFSVNAIEQLINKQVYNDEEYIVLENKEKKALHYILKTIEAKETKFYRTYGLAKRDNKEVAIALSPQHKSFKGRMNNQQLTNLKEKIMTYANNNDIQLTTANIKELYDKFYNDKVFGWILRRGNQQSQYFDFEKAYYMTFAEAANADKQFENKKYNAILEQADSKEKENNAIYAYLIKNNLIDSDNYYISRLFNLQKRNDDESNDADSECSDDEYKTVKIAGTIVLLTKTKTMLAQAFNYNKLDLVLYFLAFDYMKPIYDEDDHRTNKYKKELNDGRCLFYIKSESDYAPRHICKKDNCQICDEGIEEQADQEGNLVWKKKTIHN
ncbi:hypothetical protein BDAP_001878 [Binucleata daphniae]